MRSFNIFAFLVGIALLGVSVSVEAAPANDPLVPKLGEVLAGDSTDDADTEPGETPDESEDETDPDPVTDDEPEDEPITPAPTPPPVAGGKKINQAMDKAIAMILGTKDKFLGIKQAISGKKQPPCTGTPEQIVACEVDRIFAHEVEKMKKASAKIIAMDKQRKILSAKHVRNIREAVERVLLHAYKYAQLVTAFLAYPELEASAKKTICATYGIVLELAEYQFTVTDAKLQWKGTKAMIYEAELKNNPTLSKLGLEKTFVPSLLARVKDLKPLEAVDTQDLPYVFIADHSINVQYTLVYNTARFFNGQFQCGQ